MDLLLKGLSWVSENKMISQDIRIRGGVIHEIGADLKGMPKEEALQFKNHYVYPGLINAHDHLEMNLYPRLGHPPYQNYKTWGNDIYKPKESPIREIESTDLDLRLLWGGLKNLVSGVTSVAHHNPSKRILFKSSFPIKVLKNIAWSHSLGFSKNILKDAPKVSGKPFTVHTAEGVDDYAHTELIQLKNLGLLKKDTVLIHGVALSDQDIEILSRVGSSLIWCPASNNFLFGKTARIPILKKVIRIALGSDSTLTGSSTLLDEMREAHSTRLASAKEIFEMVTLLPADIFHLPSGKIINGGPADLVVAPILHKDYYDNLLSLHPKHLSVIFVDGNARLGNPEFSDLFNWRYVLNLQGTPKASDVNAEKLMKSIRKKVGEKILSNNPLWAMLDH